MGRTAGAYAAWSADLHRGLPVGGPRRLRVVRRGGLAHTRAVGSACAACSARREREGQGQRQRQSARHGDAMPRSPHAARTGGHVCLGAWFCAIRAILAGGRSRGCMSSGAGFSCSTIDRTQHERGLGPHRPRGTRSTRAPRRPPRIVRTPRARPRCAGRHGRQRTYMLQRRLFAQALARMKPACRLPPACRVTPIGARCGLRVCSSRSKRGDSRREGPEGRGRRRMGTRARAVGHCQPAAGRPRHTLAR